MLVKLIVFQSTHSQGVRLGWSFCICCRTNFNPRTHKECDNLIDSYTYLQCLISIHALTRSATVSCQRTRKAISISIHALTRSATHQSLLRSWVISYFNPRTHKECDLRDIINSFTLFRFQSTHSQGVRLKSESFYIVHEGISIHALTRSAT